MSPTNGLPDHVPNWLVIHANGYTDEHLTPPTLSALRAAVHGNIEMVPLVGGAPFTALCNEDGKALLLQPNAAATRLLRDVKWGPEFILGPVVITGRIDGEGDTMPLDIDTYEAIISLLVTDNPR